MRLRPRASRKAATIKGGAMLAENGLSIKSPWGVRGRCQIPRTLPARVGSGCRVTGTPGGCPRSAFAVRTKRHDE